MVASSQYTKNCLEDAKAYARQVRAGEIVTNIWIKKAIERYYTDLSRDDLTYDLDAVKKVYAFFSLLKIPIKGKFRQYELIPYQSFIILNLFLFYYKATGLRRYRTMFLFVAKKNSKTTFAAALNLFYLIMEGLIDPQSLLLASSRDQANIALEITKTIVRESPALHSRTRIMQYQIRFKSGKKRGYMKTMAADATKIDGYNPSSAVLDEVHTYKDDTIYNNVKSGAIIRENPAILMITTAGFLIDSFCNDMVIYCENILLGDVQDDTFFAMLYKLDEGDDYHDPELWDKANPGLGAIINKDNLMVEYNQAMNVSSQLPNFLTKHLNIFVEGVESWIEDQVLREAGSAFEESKYHGLDLYLGMDLSSTRDLCSIKGVVVDPEDDKFYTISRFYSANNPKRRLRQGGINLKHWINAGFIKQCQTKTIDYDMVYDDIVKLSEDFNIRGVAYDPYNSDMIVPRLESYGLDCYKFKQTAIHFNFPLKYLEKLIYDKLINLGDNPVLRWNFRNVVLYMDGNGNIKIMKNRSADSVDGVVGLGMAVGIWIAINLDSEASNLDAFKKYLSSSQDSDNIS